MTLLVTVIAAVASSLVWYNSEKARNMKVGVLCYMYWGASIMWFVDAIFEYVELRAAYFQPEVNDMINDAFLGFSAVALGLIIYVVILLIKDPAGIVKKTLTHK